MAIHPLPSLIAQRLSPRAPKSVPTASSAPQVSIGERTRLMGHVFVEGPITIGEDNIFYPYASVGLAPQDLKYKGERRKRVSVIATRYASSSPSIAAPRAAACSPRLGPTTCCQPIPMWRTTLRSAITPSCPWRDTRRTRLNRRTVLWWARIPASISFAVSGVSR